MMSYVNTSIDAGLPLIWPMFSSAMASLDSGKLPYKTQG
jgi:hypothetical protein